MLWPTQIAEKIRADHAVVKKEADLVRARLAALKPGEGLPAEVDIELEGMMQMVLDHLDREEALVLPELADGDAWAGDRTAMLLGHHAAERATIADLKERLRVHAADAIPAVLAWLDEIEAEATRENKELLNARVMADTPSNFDPGS